MADGLAIDFRIRLLFVGFITTSLPHLGFINNLHDEKPS